MSQFLCFSKRFLLCHSNARINIRNISESFVYHYQRSPKSNSKYRFQDSPSRSNSPGRRLGPGAIFLLVVPATTFALGIWQVRRRSWKVQLLEDLETKNKETPVPLPFSKLEELEYQRVIAKGKFDYRHEIYIGPRSKVTKDESGGGIISSGDNIGWHVITPFQLSDHPDKRILVNRGWVPKETLKEKKSLARIEGETELCGIVRLNEVRQQFTPKNSTSTNVWQTRDIPALAQKLGTEEIFLDADESMSVPGGPIAGQTRITLRNDHLSYLLTWFTLCGATTFMWLKKFIFV